MGTLLESIAVPELRNQAADLAELLAAETSPVELLCEKCERLSGVA